MLAFELALGMSVCGLGLQMRRDYMVIVEKDADGYFFAHVSGLNGCHTQAKSLDKLMTRIREAIELCLDDKTNHDSHSEFVGVHRVTVEM